MIVRFWPLSGLDITDPVASWTNVIHSLALLLLLLVVVTPRRPQLELQSLQDSGVLQSRWKRYGREVEERE